MRNPQWFEMCCHSHSKYLCCTFSCLYVCSEGEAEDIFPATRVLSSQIPGYDGGEVDTNETVEVMFPINVRKCL